MLSCNKINCYFLECCIFHFDGHDSCMNGDISVTFSANLLWFLWQSNTSKMHAEVNRIDS